MSNQILLTRRLAIAAILAAYPALARAQGSLLDQGQGLLNTLSKPGAGGGTAGAAGAGLSEGEIGGGLKEALKVASKKVVGQLGKSDGYFGDPAIRIPLPGPLEQVSGMLKSVGASGLLDELVLKMNRAAEQAAPKALDIFTGAVSKMSITDARGILSGPQDAATQYFKRTTSGDLTKAFHPIVDHSLADVGAVGVFKSVQAQASSIPMAGSAVSGLNLTDYTVGKGLDGLFHYIGTEEAAIRTNPAARSTDLLKKVFA